MVGDDDDDDDDDDDNDIDDDDGDDDDECENDDGSRCVLLSWYHNIVHELDAGLRLTRKYVNVST